MSADKEERIAVPSPSVVTKTGIAEEVWDRKGNPRFAVRRFDSEAVEYLDSIRIPGEFDSKGQEVVHVPADGGHLRKGMVLVPSEATPADFDEVYRDACALAFEIYDCEAAKRAEFRLLVALGI